MIEPKDFAKEVGYVEQFGVHMLSSTVHESLVFSAYLRAAEEDTAAYVTDVEKLLELDLIKDKPIKP